MKKAKAGARSSAAKGNAAPRNVDEYLAGVPEPARSTLNKVRATIRAVVPAEATEAIGYRIPTFRYKGALVAFAAFSDHCSFFPMSGSVIERFKSELKVFTPPKAPCSSRWTSRCRPRSVEKMVKARIAQNEQKQSR
jgi:uncharacterized protein YdhG (YjbR/CyaY superfamily)